MAEAPMRRMASSTWRAASMSPMCAAYRRQQRSSADPIVMARQLLAARSMSSSSSSTARTRTRRVPATYQATTATTRMMSTAQRAAPRKLGVNNSSTRSVSTAAGTAAEGGAAGTAADAARARQHALHAESMERVRAHYKIKNRTTMFYVISTILGTVAFSYGSVPLYKMICQTTGWGGQPIRAPGHGGTIDPDDLTYDPSERLRPVTSASRIRVTFNASVSDSLPWKFTPQQREVRVLPGETALAFYTATNKSDKDIIGVATYSVTPGQTAPYFSKIQCFCFEEQRLNAGETVDMPVFFYLDPDLLNDMNMRGVNEVTLSYTFFKAKYDNNGSFVSIPT
ncbi:cytochrome c oxidase assembly protein subunit 11 [Microdochium nivale]|nr:cytochrome c oxidase assembly protein subunit 11 [Microdochium nivale]